MGAGKWTAEREGGLVALASIALALAGCGIGGGLGRIGAALDQTNVELRNTVDTFDRAIDALTRESSDWQVVLQELQESLVDDVQSTMRVEVTNLARSSIIGAGSEFRCDAEYLRLRTQRELLRIRNDLAQTLNSLGLKPPLALLPEAEAEPFVCSTVPTAIDMALDPARRVTLELHGFDLRSMPITATLVSASGDQRSITNHLSVVSDMLMVIDLTDGGAAPDESSRRIILSWGEEPQAVVPVLVRSRPEVCKVRKPDVSGEPDTLIPPHTDGDQEYGGHGPCVRFTGTLRIDPAGQRIVAEVFMDAYECPDDFDRRRSDYTRAAGGKTIELFAVSVPNQRILSHNLNPSFEFEYIDDDCQDDLFPFAGTSMFEKLIFTGDTSGNEAGTETGVQMFFRQMTVQVEECTTP